VTKIAELRELGAEDLARREGEIDEEVFRLRLQRSTGQAEAPNKMRDLRRDRARIKTLLRERELAAAGGGDG
jgi:large subunit ribosomal protein L29